MHENIDDYTDYLLITFFRADHFRFLIEQQLSDPREGCGQEVTTTDNVTIFYT